MQGPRDPGEVLLCTGPLFNEPHESAILMVKCTRLYLDLTLEKPYFTESQYFCAFKQLHIGSTLMH